MADESALPTARHEHTDVSRMIIWIGVPGLIVCVVALALLVLWLFPGQTVDRTMHLPLQRYPAPELQVNPREDMAKFRAARLKWINSTGWIDKGHGIAHIPIDDAMKEIAAEGISGWPAPPARQTASPTANFLRGITYAQRTGNALPPQAMLEDEQGASVRLADIAGGKPLILVLGYYHCPNLCSVVRADLFHALERTDLVGGRDYQFVSVSIDPAETPRDAAAAKAADITRFPVAGAALGWHFLTARIDVVRAIADAVGFGDRRYGPKRTLFMHPAGVVFVTPTGVISSYLLGVGYTPGDVRLAVTKASRGTVQAAALPILLLCFDYHESTGRYTLAIVKLLRLGGVITVLTVGLTLFLAFRRDRSAP